MKYIKLLIFIIGANLGFYTHFCASGQNTNNIYDDLIKTVVIKNAYTNYSYPYYTIHKDNLILFFDDLSEQLRNFSYNIILCNSNWEPAEIDYLEYIEGFEKNYISDYSFSFNTLIPYKSYSLQIPNDDIQILVPGNYILKVFDDDNNKQVFTRRFLVISEKVDIEAEVKKATLLEMSKTHHEIDFTITSSDIDIINPYDELKVFILQNFRWETQTSNLIPKYIVDNKFIYDYENENTIPAGNEFRSFNTKNLKRISENIKEINYKAPYFYVSLFPDEKRVYKRYITQPDLNGGFKIDAENTTNPNTDADYTFVNFKLLTEVPYINGNIYVTGSFNAWELGQSNKMEYNFDENFYELQLLLKQGYYNYNYTYLENGKNFSEMDIIEGNHFETKNDYFILVYLDDFNDGYEKLIGFKKIQSKISY